MFPVISLPVTTTAPNTYTSISNTPKPILTTNGTITKAPPVQIKVEVESDDAKQNQWTHEETMILINAYKKHQPTTSDDLKAIELWKIIAKNLSGKLTVFIFLIKHFFMQLKNKIDSLSEISPKNVLEMAEFGAHIQSCDQIQSNKHKICILQ
jgi:hypothetical protein